MTYNDPEIVQAILNVKSRKEMIKALLKADKIPLRINPRATLEGWADLFRTHAIPMNPAIPQ